MSNILAFPTPPHAAAPAPVPEYTAKPLFRVGDTVVMKTRPCRVGIVRQVYVCPVFKIITCVLVDFPYTRSWVTPNDLRVLRASVQ